ncbi:tetratricopeptide repeat protein [Pseudomonas putida]|jgi:tetratricopeptide (TPR) repeat protein|uniref:tetratricopeptide repeat protein n=1 Tax=Pseudomonas putida TaxID=303 RepID=UPI002363A42F|nr:tetratricopeptide repeat protein [Pseudomonas putida]MDD2102955.1 tetratricopeptide repeat protein [Pseudomonas putida]
MKKIITCLLCGVLSQSVWALDAADQQRLNGIQQSWAHIQYELPEDQRTAAFEKLAAQAASFTQERQAVAEAWIWSGIVTSSWAGAQGGLGALGKVKAARADLEKALTLDPKALQGSAYTSLGALYDRVPGWPIGFGDSDKAEQLLKVALQMNPNGIDSLYFWGDHLYRQKRYVEARAALQKALLAAPRPGRESADAGRRKEIEALLVDVNKKLG